VICSRLAAEVFGIEGVFIRILVGIDVGGTKLALALADAEGRLLARRRRPTEPSRDPAADWARIVGDVRDLLAEAGVTLADVAAVGVSLPGPLDRERGVLLEPPNLPGWSEVPVRELLEAALERPVHLENDANAATLAEWRHGAGRGASHLAYLTMSTGVGAGLVLGGRLYRKRAGSAGEVGHARVEWDGALCGCGRRGCLEAYCGGAAWTRRLREITPEASRVAALAGGPAGARPEHVVAAAGEGDAFALAELDRYNRYLARGLVNLVFTLAPEVVVLGTIPSRAGEALCLGPVRERVNAELWPLLARGLEIRAAALGEELGYYAGVCVAREAMAGSSSSP
jgi:glucokinase